MLCRADWQAIFDQVPGGQVQAGNCLVSQVYTYGPVGSGTMHYIYVPSQFCRGEHRPA